MVWSFQPGMIDMNVFLYPLNLNFSSTLPVILAPFHELSYPLSCTSLSIVPDARGTIANPKEIHSSLYCPLIFSYPGKVLWTFISVIKMNECGTFNLSHVKLYSTHCLYLHCTFFCVNGKFYEERFASISPTPSLRHLIGGQLRFLGSSSSVPIFLMSEANPIQLK